MKTYSENSLLKVRMRLLICHLLLKRLFVNKLIVLKTSTQLVQILSGILIKVR
jgi:hypothetical protein